MARNVDIGVIGGTGVYTLLEDPETVDMNDDENKQSDIFMVGSIGGKSVAFLPRHGNKHTIPPHKVPYMANIDAFSKLGVVRLISSSAVGSLNKDYRPGDFIFTDQFINMTSGRKDTFFDKEPVTHVSTAFPYCNELRDIAISSAKKLGMRYHDKGTVVVVNGPRFSSAAESKFFRSIGADVINMTQYPEVTLAREKSMCYLNISIVTDYDAGLGDILGPEGGPVSYDEVEKRFAESVDGLKKLIADIIPNIPEERRCSCKDSLVGAVVGGKEG